MNNKQIRKLEKFEMNIKNIKPKNKNDFEKIKKIELDNLKHYLKNVKYLYKKVKKLKWTTYINS